MSMIKIEQTDACLKGYYATMGVNDYNGKFTDWCKENNMDDEDIQADIDNDGHQAAFVDFDDQFPLSIEDDDTNAEQRAHKIYDTIKSCWDNPDAYSAPVSKADETDEKKEASDDTVLQNDDDEKQMVSEITKELIERKNALILCLAIAKYDQDNLENLNTGKDVSMYQSLFEKTYNYKFITNQSKQMNAQEVTDFFKRAKSVLYDFNALKLNYDALIVTYGGHGTDDSIICSDGTKVPYKAVRAIFNTEDEFAKIPKIFLIDACRINDDASDDDNKNEPEPEKGRAPTRNVAKTFSITLMQSEGNEVYGAKICEFITAQLKENDETKVYTDFRTVFTEAKKKLDAATDNQTIILAEHDIDVDAIKLMPRIASSRGTKDKRYVADSRQTSPADDEKESSGLPTTADTLRTFLVTIEMDAYCNTFKENSLDTVEALRDVDDEKLKSLGIENASHREKLLQEIPKQFQ